MKPNNNAPYCNSYNNDYEEEPLIKEQKNTEKELNKIFEDMKENSKTVQERDIITIKDINNKEKI